MKVAVTVQYAYQISPDDWQTARKTKVFESGTTIDHILQWAKIWNSNSNFGNLIFSEAL